MTKKKPKMDAKNPVENAQTPPVADDTAAAQQQAEGNAGQAGEQQAKLQILADACEKAIKEKDEYIALAQRLQADFDNYRRRNQNARQDAYDEAVRDTLQKMLAVLDNLERAAVAQGSEESIREGVQMVLKQFTGVLAANGVEEIAADGAAFDPNLHNAVMQEPADGVESGTITMVLQKGFKQGDRVLRHSMVKVAE